MYNKIKYYIKRPRVFLGRVKRFTIRKIKIYIKPVRVFLGKIKSYILKKISTLPSVTVIIPTYKDNEFIDDSINSVLNQNYKKNRLKIIVVVNGKDYIYYTKLKEEYKSNNKINVIYTEVPGQDYARNYALNYVDTKYITFLDDDDLFTSNYLKDLLLDLKKDTKIICGKLIDMKSDNTYNYDTYINSVINNATEEYTNNYFPILSLFSAVTAKVYDTNYYKELDKTENSLLHAEDIYFWVRNVSKLNVRIKLVATNSQEAYIRRITNNSMSRPSKDLYKFYITDTLDIISLFEKELLDEKNDITAKRFILNKIVSQTKLMLNYYNNLEEKLKLKVIDSINKSKLLFINKSKFGLEKGIAFCHNFTPFIDASSFVASKRLSKVSELSGELINWDVISADMTNCRQKDFYFNMFYSSFQYTNITMLPGNAYFNEKAQYFWGERAFKEVEDKEYKYIYSRSMWAGSHIAAYLYKQKYPNTIWYAEFSDPLYMDTNNDKRPCTEYTEDDSHLNNFWYNVEKIVYDFADRIIFTNNNQKDYMIDYHEEDIADKEKRCIVLNHPIIDSRYSKIINTNYYMENEKINIGFFGNFYKNRNGKDLIKFLDNPNVVIHLFTSTSDDIPNNDRIIINKPVSNLEFLNIASKMDYLFLNDIEFSGEINPYLPSKLADYLVTDTPIIALVNIGTELEKYESKQIIKIYRLSEKFIENFKIRKPKYDIKVIDIPYYKELYTSVCLDFETISKDILDGKANLGYNSLDMPPLYDEKGQIRWEFNEKIDNINTFYLYYYGLRTVYTLSKAYSINGNEEYIELSKKIVKSFYDMLKKNSIDNSMIFNDHAQSERIENIVFLYSVLEKYNLENDIEKECIYIINDALEKLMGDKYYQKNHNHGIIADKACLIGLCFLKKKDKTKYIQDRLMTQINHAFTKDGVHIENSVDYHYTVVQNIMFCINMMKYMKLDIDKKLNTTLNNIFDFMIFSTKPNGSRILYGDSKGENNKKNGQENFGNKKLEYIVTEGKKGEKPNEYFKYFESGYIFIREHYEKENFKDATWISLKAGYKTRIHKHQDDMSLCLYSKGHDIFVDAGMYNYIPKDPIKDYMESLPAHNTICIKNKPYSIASGNGDKFKILARRTNKEYDYVLCASSIYPYTLIYRNLYYVKDINVIIVQDNIFSEKTNEYAQYFHLGENVSITKKDINKTILSLKDSEFNVYINQISKPNEQNILKGLQTKPYSLISEGFGKYVNSQTLEYTKKGKNESFITIIDIAKENDIAKITKKDNELIITKSDKTKTIILESQDNINEYTKDIAVDYINGELIINNPNLGENIQCVYAFVDSKMEPIKNNYTAEPTIKLNCKDYKDIKVMYYLKNKNAMEKHGILCTINDGKLKKYSKLHYPKVIEHKISNINNKYVFNVDIEYDFECSYRWFVYLNGAQIYFENNSNNTFEYELEETGDYVIMVSVSNKYFREFDFYQFDIVNKV